jgi:type I restriction enzyme S subunit
MIADLKPYAEYKESGLPWLGRVPGHWEVRLARQVGRLVKGVGGTKEDAVADGVPCVRYGELYTTYRGFIRAAKTCVSPARSAAYTPIHYGDVLFAASGEKMEEIGKSAVNLMTVPAVCGGDVIVLRPSGVVHAPFLGYACDTHHAAHQKATMGRGTTIKHIYPDELRSLALPLPPPEEQAAIVRFLDWANGRLERAIRAKRKVIALLNEQKQAIIHRAVTRGLDPSVPLKPSGIPWLGDIPAHWEVRRAKQVCNAIVDCKNRTPEPVDGGGYVVVRTTNIRQGHFNPKGSYTTNRRNYEVWTQRGAPRFGDVFFTREAPVGEACLVPEHENLCMGQRMMYFRPDTAALDAEFLLHSIYGPVVRRYIEVEANGSTVGHLRLGQVSALPLLWCPIEEQKRIMAYVGRESGPLNHAISRLEREIDLLREYRTRLVADVVTGKLDVREAAARLPEEEALLDTPDTSDTDPDDDLAPDEEADA